MSPHPTTTRTQITFPSESSCPDPRSVLNICVSDLDAAPLVLHDFGVRTPDGFETSPLSCSAETGETLLIVGPTSSGKSILFEALSGIKRPQVELRGEAHLDPQLALVPQDSRLAALPTDSVWSILGLRRRDFIARRLLGHHRRPSDGEKTASRLLLRLGMHLDRIFDRPVSTLSAGERRRLVCVAALLRRPRLLLIDGWEEFSDPVLRGQLVDLLEEQCREGMTLLVSARHYPPLDLSFKTALELDPTASAVDAALPLVQGSKNQAEHLPLLSVAGLVLERRQRTNWGTHRASYPVDGASLGVFSGETLCLLGPSGSGKSSLLFAVAGLLSPAQGSIRFNDRDITWSRGRRAQRLRRQIQLVFHDAASALDAGKSVFSHLQDAAYLGKVKGADFRNWLERMGLSPSLLEEGVDRLSASESQRIDLARSLILEPQLLLWDGPEVGGAETDGGFLAGCLKQEKATGRAFLIATQSPHVVEALGDRVAVMYAGRIIETGSAKEVLQTPAHPMTSAYLSGGDVPSTDPFAPASGCSFVKACPHRKLPQCAEQEPNLVDLVPAGPSNESTLTRRRQCACFFPTSD